MGFAALYPSYDLRPRHGPGSGVGVGVGWVERSETHRASQDPDENLLTTYDPLPDRQSGAQQHRTGRQCRDRDPDRGADQPWCFWLAWDVGFLASAHHRQSSPGAYGIGTIHGGKGWLTPSIR